MKLGDMVKMLQQVYATGECPYCGRNVIVYTRETDTEIRCSHCGWAMGISRELEETLIMVREKEGITGYC